MEIVKTDAALFDLSGWRKPIFRSEEMQRKGAPIAVLRRKGEILLFTLFSGPPEALEYIMNP
jgi:hypothetical protein